MAKKESLLIRLVKILPKRLQLSFIGIKKLECREIYKTYLPGMLPMIDQNKKQSQYLKKYLADNNIENAESVFIDMDNATLHALYYPSKNGKFICAFHGIKGNWLNNPPEKTSAAEYNPYYRMLALKEFAHHGFGFLAFSLPGFEPSTGKPSEATITNACKKFAQYTINNLGIQNNNLIVWGESLGSAAAAIFAGILTKNNYAPGVLSLVAPFDSMIGMVRNKFPYFSEEELESRLSEKLNTKKNIELLDKKQTFIHIISSKDDSVIPLNNTLNLVYRARELGFNVLYHSTAGDHTTWSTSEMARGKMATHAAREKNIEIAEKYSILDIEKLTGKI